MSSPPWPGPDKTDRTLCLADDRTPDADQSNDPSIPCDRTESTVFMRVRSARSGNELCGLGILLVSLAGWINRYQQHVIEYLVAEKLPGHRVCGTARFEASDFLLILKVRHVSTWV